MSDTLSAPTMDPMPIVSGPVEDDTTSPTRPTFEEYIDQNAAAAWNSATEVWNHPAAFNSDVATPSSQADIDAATSSLGLEGPTYAAPAPPAYHPVSAEDANAQAKAKGADLAIPFTAPTTQEALDGIIPEQLANQKAAEVTANYSPGIADRSANFVTSSLVSLADPRNDAAFLLPVIGAEAVGAKVAAALGQGVVGRVASRTAQAAVAGAEQGIVLQPAQWSQAHQDHEDYTIGQALHSIAMQTFLNAGIGGAGGIFGKGVTPSPDTVNAVAKASISQAVNDAPGGVDIKAIVDNGPKTLPVQADVPAGPMPADTPQLAEGSRAAVFAGGKWVAGDVGTEGGFGYGQLLHGDDGRVYTSRMDGMTPLKDGEPAPTTPPQFVTDPYWDAQRSTAERQQIQAEQSARDMAQRARNPVNLELAQAQRANQTTMETAPKLTGDAAADQAAADQMVADKQAQHDALVANGRTAELPPELEPAEQDFLKQHAARESYAACMIGV